MIWIENMNQAIRKNSMYKPWLALSLGLMVLLLSSCGITAPRGNEGYANLDSPGMNDTDRTMTISLGPTVLWFAAKFLDDEPET